MKGKREKPPFTREDFVVEARILSAAAALMDGREARAQLYRKLAMMLVWADANLPPGLPLFKGGGQAR